MNLRKPGERCSPSSCGVSGDDPGQDSRGDQPWDIPTMHLAHDVQALGLQPHEPSSKALAKRFFRWAALKRPSKLPEASRRVSCLSPSIVNFLRGDISDFIKP